MRFRVFVSGDTEKKGIPKLLDKLFIENNFIGRHEHIVRKEASGRTSLLNGINNFVKNSLNDKHLSCVISLEDTDSSDLEAIKEAYRQNVSEQYRHKYRPKFAKTEIETWLIADSKTLREYGITDFKELENPEVQITFKSSHYLSDLFTRNSKTYKKTVDGVALLGLLNIKAVYQKCPSFKNFIDNIFEVLNEPNPYLNP